MLHCYKRILYYIFIIILVFNSDFKRIKIKTFSWAPGCVPTVPNGPNYCNSLQTGLPASYPPNPFFSQYPESSFFFFYFSPWSSFYLFIYLFCVCVSFCFITKLISYTYTYIPISLPSCISLPPTLPIPPL